MKQLLLFRAFVCFHIVGLIGFVAHYFPRSRTRARIVNFLTAPFFGPAGYWAIRSNPNLAELRRKMEGSSKEGEANV